ncbi:MAG: tRNA uridine-5-carboxymethylaminomethyl(34) synthesis enzyme MnmG [Planctomycetota bacterium]|nr:tRNA uridine-5-carboxymethylaminomethyl(34) synthesis enzyme MnmG [Planctomycetota bacterium]
MSVRAFDVVVVGGGHAGLEAAAAAARMGASTALLTLRADAVGRMSCNPAIGGIGKGQLAREVDALGGWMGRITDAAGIQFRMLNTSKGRAVRSPRAQCDRDAYEAAAQAMCAAQEGLETVEGEAVDFLRSPEGAIAGVRLADGSELRARAVVLTTGTFLEGVMHTGLQQRAGGRVGESGAAPLGAALRALGLPTARLKTGTPPRLAADSVDYAALAEQPGDLDPTPFSFLTSALTRPQISCWLTRTTAATHAIVREHLHESPMYAGRIEGVGPRYCPSLEDKVVRYAEKDQHTIFLEPEGWDSPLLYANGISTSLPAEVQEAFVRTCVGMERARIVQHGYAVEYTHVAPRALRRTLEARDWPGLFLAGQICGTSGYEEAAAQGLVAGANAALRARGDGREFVLGRHEGYVGVLVDDLVTCDPSEPYRMFTSRAEYRLLLRADNADLRLTPRAQEFGLSEPRRDRVLDERRARLARARALLTERRDPEDDGTSGKRRALIDRLRAPGGTIEELRPLAPELESIGLTRGDVETLESDVLYEGYARRQNAWVERASEREVAAIPDAFDYAAVSGLRIEARQSLLGARPATLGAAGRLAGVTPADVALLEVAVVRAARAL